MSYLKKTPNGELLLKYRILINFASGQKFDFFVGSWYIVIRFTFKEGYPDKYVAFDGVS